MNNNDLDRRLAELIGEEWCWETCPMDDQDEYNNMWCPEDCPSINRGPCTLDECRHFNNNTAPLPFTFSWDACGKAIEWARKHYMMVSAGPTSAFVVVFDPETKEAWTYQMAIENNCVTAAITAALVAALEKS